jgi:rubrerythrin
MEKRAPKKPTLEQRTAKLLVYGSDQGHFGSSSCGNCSYTFKKDEPTNICPKCNYALTERDVSFNMGGSDF